MSLRYDHDTYHRILIKILYKLNIYPYVITWTQKGTQIKKNIRAESNIKHTNSTNFNGAKSLQLVMLKRRRKVHGAWSILRSTLDSLR